jgi:hypothetical protein
LLISAEPLTLLAFGLRGGRRGAEKGRSRKRDGVEDDWGETGPLWCLSCGCGDRSVERVSAHPSEAGRGSESMSVGSGGLTNKQYLEDFKLRNRWPEGTDAFGFA